MSINSLQEAQNWEKRKGLHEATFGALVIGGLIGGVASSLALGVAAGCLVSAHGFHKMIQAKKITPDKVEKILRNKEGTLRNQIYGG